MPLFEWLILLVQEDLLIQFKLTILKDRVMIAAWVPILNLIFCCVLLFIILWYWYIICKGYLMLWWMQTKIRKIMKKHGSKG